MSFAEVEDILDDVELALLPTGSNEGHGPHLPLKVDAATSTYVSAHNSPNSPLPEQPPTFAISSITCRCELRWRYTPKPGDNRPPA